MSDSPKVKRERSPSFPFIPLSTALEKLEAFEKAFGRHPTPANRAGTAWNIKPDSSQSYQTLAALKSFELLAYEGSGPRRLVSMTEDARTYLRANQRSIRDRIVREAALAPRVIHKYWEKWGKDRPSDEISLDALTIDDSFTESAAKTFLHVYDDTISFAKLDNREGKDDQTDLPDVSPGDFIQWESDGAFMFSQPKRVCEVQDNWVWVDESDTAIPRAEIIINQDHRPKPEGVTREPPAPERFRPAAEKAPANDARSNKSPTLSGFLSKEVGFELFVNGEYGPRELDKLIKILTIQKEILED